MRTCCYLYIMRNFKQVITDLIKKPPMLFPFIALAHLLWLVWTIWNNTSVPVGGVEWLQVLWLLVYTICWLAACDLRKWGAIGYMLLTMTNVVIFLTARTVYARDVYMSSIFLIDVMFCFFLLLYYKRFGNNQTATDEQGTKVI